MLVMKGSKGSISALYGNMCELNDLFKHFGQQVVDILQLYQHMF